MSEQSVLTGRVETFNFGVQALNGEILTSPVYRLVIDVSFGSLLGAFQSGYYVRVNDSAYFVSKQTIQVTTLAEAEKVFAFLAKTKLPFTISVRHEKTLSGHQYIDLFDVTTDTELYSLREYKAYKGLWRTIEGELFENLYSPSIARFTSEKLDWYVKLIPEYSLMFQQTSTISVKFFDSQGHLEIFKIIANEPYAFPGNLYLRRKSLVFFNHTVNGLLEVIPLGREKRVLHVGEETTITSPDHLSITLSVGEYLLFHPIPRDGAD